MIANGFSLSNLLPALRKTIEDPLANPMQTIVVIGAITIITLILVLVGLIAYFIISNRVDKAQRLTLPTRQMTRREKIIGWAVLAVLAIGFYVTASMYIGKTETCVMCHAESRQVKSLQASAHKGVACLSCHQRPGLVGYVTLGFDYLRWAGNFTEADSVKHQAEVYDGACLRCHGKVAGRTTTRIGIRVSHREIIDAGHRCVDCHNAVAHGEQGPNPRRPSMAKCVGCHDSRIASSACNTCHVPDSGSGNGQRLFAREHLITPLVPPPNCRGCHNINKSCNPCHGLEMPHTYEFKKKGKHALLSMQNRDICWRCHEGPETKFCNGCHRFPTPHGDPRKWLTTHGAAANSAAAIYWEPAEGSIRGCGGCHSGERLCALCHTDGRKPANPKDLMKKRAEEKRLLEERQQTIRTTNPAEEPEPE